MHVDPRRLQLSQIVPVEGLKMHRTLRRLHSQQLRVPLRTFLRFVWGPSSWSISVIGK